MVRSSLAILFILTGIHGGTILADWPQFLGPHGTGVSDESGFARSFPEGGPKVLWSAKVAPGFSGAAVHSGQVFFLDRKEAARPEGASESTAVPAEDILRCFDLNTGEETQLLSYEAPGAKY